jgi:hypothetical protein
MRATIEALPDAAAAAAAAAALAAAAQQAPIRKPRGRRQTGGERRKTGGWLGGLFGCFGGSALRGGAVPQPARASAAPAPAAAVADVSKQGASAASSVPAAGGLVAAAAAAGMAAPASETRQGRAPGQAKEQPAAAARAVGNGHGGTGGRGGGHHHRTASQSMAADGRLQAAAQQLVAVGSAVDGGAGGGGRAAPVTGHSSAETTSDAVPELPEILGGFPSGPAAAFGECLLLGCKPTAVGVGHSMGSAPSVPLRLVLCTLQLAASAATPPAATANVPWRVLPPLHRISARPSTALPCPPLLAGPLAKRVPSLESKSMTALDCKKKLAVESLPLPAQQVGGRRAQLLRTDPACRQRSCLLPSRRPVEHMSECPNRVSQQLMTAIKHGHQVSHALLTQLFSAQKPMAAPAASAPAAPEQAVCATQLGQRQPDA